jgi:hypothetical protein
VRRLASWEEFPDLFAPEATCIYVGLGTFRGDDELRELAETYFESSYEYIRHEFSQLVDGHEATGSLLLPVALDHHDGTFEWRFGRDEDEYRRIDGRWKFQRMTMESDSVLRGRVRRPQGLRTHPAAPLRAETHTEVEAACW